MTTEENTLEDGSVVTTTTTTTVTKTEKKETVVKPVVGKTSGSTSEENVTMGAEPITNITDEKDSSPPSKNRSAPSQVPPSPPEATGAIPDDFPGDGEDMNRERRTEATAAAAAAAAPSIEKGKVAVPYEGTEAIHLGLRVYTHKDYPAVVAGKLK